jgi:glycine cleavage system regulatory protein
MQIPLVMTVIGKDRTGLVESIARLVSEHEGNWLESRMCRLGGEFAGILRVHVPGEKRAALEQALAGMSDLNIVVRSDGSERALGEPRIAFLEVVGPDRPGIVKEISHAVAAQGVNVEELTTECISAPMSGEPLFQARMKLLLSAEMTSATLRRSLAKPAGDLGLEYSVSGD